MRIRKRTIAIGTVAAIALFVAAKWGAIIFYLFLFVGVLPVVLFFQQDYHPWEDSIDDMAVVSLDTDAVPDTHDISQMAAAAATDHDACVPFINRLRDQRGFSVEAQTYCKIRIQTECPCTGRGFAGPGKWLKVHLTRGPQKGADAWVCGSAVAKTVTAL